MPRKNKKAPRKYKSRMSFNELCRKAGITPKQKILIRRHLLEKKTINLKIEMG